MHVDGRSFRTPGDLPHLIASIGEEAFGERLLSVLHEVSGAEHCMVFRSDGDTLAEVAAVSGDGTDTAHRQVKIYLEQQLWRRDWMVTQAQDALEDASSSLMHADISTIGDRNLWDAVWGRSGVRDRILVCGRWQHGLIGLSILRSEGAGSFSDRSIDNMNNITEMLLSILAKHAQFMCERTDISIALTSLGEIERTIGQTQDGLSPRETSVCARILYGMSSIGIALDLGISEETVMTYRKRSYARLAIGSQRELLLWYVKQWSKQADLCVRNLLH